MLAFKVEMKLLLKPLHGLICLVALALLVQGCQVQGLSGPGRTTTLGYDLTKLTVKKNVPQVVKLPLHLVVAQAGSLQPDSRLLNELKRYKKIFGKISVLPASPELRNFAEEVHQRDPENLLKLAEGLGGELLFLVGGRVDSQSSRTPISILDLTILGHYLVPSNKIKSKASALGAVIQVSNRKLLMTVEGDLSKTKFAPSVSRHTKTDELSDEIIGKLLRNIAGKFSEKLAFNAGVKTEAKEVVELEEILNKTLKKTATVYVISDGFHIGLILPYGEKNGLKQYIEIGLGERNWAMDQNWRWLNGVMSGLAHHEGVAVLEVMNGPSFLDKIKSQKRVWKLNLSERQWGEMLTTLEKDLALQEVIYDVGQVKVIKTTLGYHLFSTCQQFALNPLGVADKRLFGHSTMPTPLLERHLDIIFAKSAVIK